MGIAHPGHILIESTEPGGILGCYPGDHIDLRINDSPVLRSHIYDVSSGLPTETVIDIDIDLLTETVIDIRPVPKPTGPTPEQWQKLLHRVERIEHHLGIQL